MIYQPMLVIETEVYIYIKFVVLDCFNVLILKNKKNIKNT